ncbi:MAG: phosphate acetyltransferase [Gammaproteobacteria bacterium]|jgi:phosphate acetyltransferase
MSLLNQILDKAKTTKNRIVLAEGEDLRVLKAAARAQADGLADCILVGDQKKIAALAVQNGISLGSLQLEEPRYSKHYSNYCEYLVELRQHKGLTLDVAREQVLDPLCFADLMVSNGNADGSIAGALYTTGDRIRSALKIIGVADGFDTVSSFFLMLFEKRHHDPKRAMIFADCSLVIEPDSAQLVEIAAASIEAARGLINVPPRVAMLSFSTNGSAQHPKVYTVRQATEQLRRQFPDVAIDGEIQLDAALVESVARQKYPESQVKGEANILIFPDLGSANIGYKLVQRLAGAVAIGPILQGMKRPANDLSRGCSIDDVYYLIGLTAVQSAVGRD